MDSAALESSRTGAGKAETLPSTCEAASPGLGVSLREAFTCV